MMDDPEEIKAWDDLVWKVVRWAAWDFPEMDRDELYQNLWEAVLIAKHRKPTLTAEAPHMTTALQKAATTRCWDQRKEQLHQSVQYLYRTTDVRKILETSFHYLEWPDGWVPEDAESEDMMASIDTRADIIQAVQRLSPPQYKEAILRRYRDGIEDPTSSIEGRRLRKRLNRAIEKLTTTLNWYYPQKHDGPGRRRALSNTAAQGLIRRQGDQ